jgi:hypothetical protein
MSICGRSWSPPIRRIEQPLSICGSGPRHQWNPGMEYRHGRHAGRHGVAAADLGLSATMVCTRLDCDRKVPPAQEQTMADIANRRKAQAVVAAAAALRSEMKRPLKLDLQL